MKWGVTVSVKIKHNAITALLFGVYIGLIFYIPLEKNSVFLMAFIGSIFSTVLHWFTIQIAVSENNDVKSKFSWWSILTVGYSVFCGQIAVGILLLAIGEYVSFWIVFGGEMCFIIVGIVNMMFVETIDDEITRDEIASLIDIYNEDPVEIKCIESLTTKVLILMNQNPHKELVHVFDVMYELVRYSDPDENEELEQLEKEMHDIMDKITIILPRKDIGNTLTCCKIFTKLVEERNLKCRLLSSPNGQSGKVEKIDVAKELEEIKKLQARYTYMAEDDEIIP